MAASVQSADKAIDDCVLTIVNPPKIGGGSKFSDVFQFFILPPRKGPFLLTRDEKNGVAGQEDRMEVDENEVMSHTAAGYVEIEGTMYHMEHYLGNEWHQTHLLGLHNAPEMKVPDNLAVTPHPHQIKGSAKMDYLCKSIFKGGICADEMGLGKTLLAIMVMEMAKNERGSFSLVVCPAGCRSQWKREIRRAYKKGFEPRVLILEDSGMTAHSLLAGQWDIVIVSYHFLLTNFRAIQSFKERMEGVRKSQGPRPTRPVAALLSGYWRLLGLPIKRLVLDECHLIKKEDGAFYHSVQALYRRATVMLSGTIFGNEWHDVSNPLTLLQGHPFTTKRKFMHAFSTENPMGPNGPNIVYLQRFLLAVLIARPSTCITLPGITCKDAAFSLTEKDASFVTDLTLKFTRARYLLLAQNKGARPDPSSSTSSALGYAVQAQLWAASPLLTDDFVTPSEDMDVVEIEPELNNTVTRIVESEEFEALQSRSSWLSQLDTIETQKLLSPRVEAVMKLVQFVRQEFRGEKIVIFSCFLKFLDLVAASIKVEFGMHCMRYDGTMDKIQKRIIQERFLSSDGSVPLLITSGSGGVGLNLQCASIVIQCEIWWNKNSERQAYARCFRQGQTKQVKVFRLYATNSPIDVEVKACQSRKARVNFELMGPLIRHDEGPLNVPSFES